MTKKKIHFKLAAKSNKRKGFRLEGKAAAPKRLEELKRETKTKPKVKAAQQLPASEREGDGVRTKVFS